MFPFVVLSCDIIFEIIKKTNKTLDFQKYLWVFSYLFVLLELCITQTIKRLERARGLLLARPPGTGSWLSPLPLPYSQVILHQGDLSCQARWPMAAHPSDHQSNLCLYLSLQRYTYMLPAVKLDTFLPLASVAQPGPAGVQLIPRAVCSLRMAAISASIWANS